MKRLILSAITAALVIVPATAASATGNHEPKNPDPCPGEHVQVYNAANDHNFPEVGKHFVCGPIKGEKGDTGADGTNGTNGVDGAQGPAGPQGEPGKDGKRGPRGFTGLPGVQGTDGIDGKDGIDGTDGVNGLDGASGVDGINGFDGRNGSDGQAANEAELRALITELNNRLFILEHTAPATPEAPVQDSPVAETPVTAVPEQPITHGELPRTGSNTPYLVALGGIMLLAGIAARMAFARR